MLTRHMWTLHCNPQHTLLQSGIVTEVGDNVRVVVGEQGVDWSWTEGGDCAITATHCSGATASLHVRVIVVVDVRWRSMAGPHATCVPSSLRCSPDPEP